MLIVQPPDYCVPREAAVPDIPYYDPNCLLALQLSEKNKQNPLYVERFEARRVSLWEIWASATEQRTTL